MNQRQRIWTPEIFARRTRELELPTINLGISGYFHLKMIDGRTKRVKQQLTFKNLIVDAGMNAVGGGSILDDLNTYVAVGTGSAAPTNADTGLGVEVGRTSNGRTLSYVFGAANAYISVTTTWTLLEAVGNGNLTEVGVFKNSSGAPMFCRQLIKDGGGTPTTLTKTSSDQLQISYERRINIPADVVSTIVVNGTSYDYTIRAINVNNGGTDGWSAANTHGLIYSLGSTTRTIKVVEDNTLDAKTASVNPAATTPTTNSSSAYVNGNFFVDQTATFDPGIANFATGVGKILMWAGQGSGSFTPNPTFETAFTTTKLPKNNTQRLTVVQRLAWARV